jgi:glycosyltransferase involved in cell wall biosynthesis
VVDDGSTDETADIAREFCLADKRIRYIYQENTGPSAARNRGLREAAGAYLQFLDADDLIESDKFNFQLSAFAENPDAGLVYSDARYFYSNEPGRLLYSFWNEQEPWMPYISGSGPRLVESIVRQNPFVVSSPLIDLDLIRRCGYFDENLRIHEDWDYWLRAAQAGFQFVYNGSHERTRTLIRAHRSSVSADRDRMLESNLVFRNELNHRLSDALLRELNTKLIYQTCRDQTDFSVPGSFAYKLRFLARHLLRRGLISEFLRAAAHIVVSARQTL